MKQRIYFLLLSVVLIFSSCRDKSGEFVEQLFTDDQISAALRQCIDSTSFKTCNLLCMVDTVEQQIGYFYYDSKSYRIKLIAEPITDTLIAHGYEDEIDSLIYFLNRAAEQCGNSITQFWTSVIKDITFPSPYSVLHGGDSAITEYVKATKQSEFVANLVSSVLFVRLNELDVFNRWNSLQEKYSEIIGSFSPSPIDITNATAQQMVAGFFRKMAIEEDAIRKDPSLRGSQSGLLYRVFATLDN